MTDVENATVNFERQKKAPFGQQPNATASVVIQLVGGRTLDEGRVEMIREMTAAWFALTPEKVTVSDLSGRRVHAPPSEDGLGSGGNHRYIITKSAQDKLYEKNIYDALAYVPGVVVAVNTELETDLTTSIEKTVHDPKAVPINPREESTATNSETAAPRGAPGLNAQQWPLPNQAVRISNTVNGSSSAEERSSSEVHNVVNRENTSVKKIGLTPKRVKVSVGIPSTYFEQIWRENNPTPPGQPLQRPDPTALANIETEEIARIRDFVVPLIPKPTDVLDSTPMVTVKKFHHFKPVEIPQPTTANAALEWLALNWSTLGIIGLVLVSLLMMRSMVRSPVVQRKSLDLPLPARTQPGEEKRVAAEHTAELPKHRLKRRVREGGSLREDLVEMVREDPDAAANILRSWIGNAS
jgi:flagellar M-ring protein FliF